MIYSVPDRVLYVNKEENLTRNLRNMLVYIKIHMYIVG